MQKEVTKKVTGGILIISLLLLLGVIAATAVSPPPALPNKFWGNVSVNGVDAPTDTIIEAYIDGELRGTTTVGIEGEYGNNLNYLAVTGTLYDRGKIITFVITLPDGRVMTAQETAEWGRMQPPRKVDLTGVAPPLVTDPSANPAIIPDDTDDTPLWGEEAELSVTVTDICAIDSVTIDLSQIGGDSEAVMTDTGGGVYTIVTNASDGTTPGTYLLPVNATNAPGLSETSVSVELTVKKNGDVDDDGDVDEDDVVYLGCYALGVPGYDLNERIADVDGSGVVNLLDAVYLASHINGIAGYELLR
ncbi:MAG: conserved hypothetical protein, secreted [Candidatus Syntrophoarchaeum caldarius]|uniref:Dockerin domain-containing protein n=1 Tax=Candidatus Syntropharchaeum caldarium TaxID=1838285 RepID=A0A1F2PA98_9EURY|nr:MAG: conserved hypothetical protein, secreted [Candidatus Syntrophoarchaeum caldarius]